MSDTLVLSSEGTVNLNVVPVTLANELPLSSVATRGGEATTSGGMWPVASRWLRVMDESSLGHMITIGDLAICWPKPLRVLDIASCMGATSVNVHGHPTHLLTRDGSDGGDGVCGIG